MASRPVDDVTLRAIATEAGLAASNVVRHVGSREELLLDVMDQEYGSWLAELDQLVSHQPAVVDTGWMAATIAETLGQRPLLETLIEVSPRLLRHPPSLRAREQGQRNGQALAELVQTALGSTFAPFDRLYLVAGLHAAVSNAAAWSRQDAFPVDRGVVVRDLVQIQFDGLLARTARAQSRN